MKNSKLKMKEYTISHDGHLSNYCLDNDITDLNKLAFWLRHLPYGRTKSRTDLTQLFTENKGTCSSKHGLFKSVAIENNYSEFKLIMGIFEMNSLNTPGIRDALVSSTVSYIPEAHSYIRFKNETLDLTNADSSFDNFKSDLLQEIEIQPNQIGQFKVEYHKQYLKDWIDHENIDIEFDKLWMLREKCIYNLSLVD